MSLDGVAFLVLFYRGVGYLPVEKVAEYGIGILALVVVFWLGKIFLEGYFVDQKAKLEAAGKSDPAVVDVIEKNTKAFEQMTSLIHIIQVSVVEQGVKLDELLARARGSK